MTIMERLNAPTAPERLAQLETLLREETAKPAVLPQYANNHIHTSYSFSPYSPTAAVWFARAAGLNTAGIMDHDSIAGAREFLQAGELAGVGTTCGLECRVRLDGSGLEHRRVNNPDQSGIAYMALHSVPHGSIELLQERFAPLREKRNERNAKIIEKINALTAPYGIAITLPQAIALSQYAVGGSVTERHVLYALAMEITAQKGQQNVCAFLQEEMQIPLKDKEIAALTDENNPHFLYDLLGVLKAQLVERIYVDADEECLHITQLSDLAKETGALLCYAYLGDVTDSVTGDKRAQKFEDDYLDELFALLKGYGVDGITYMPSRNTPAQLARVMALCEKEGFLQISGEDINSPRQGFLCKQLEQPEFRHLIDATRMLIAHERGENVGKIPPFVG